MVNCFVLTSLNLTYFYSSLQSIPRHIWLDRSGKQLVQWPIEEINKLHGKKVSFLDKKIDSESIFEVQGITAAQVNS